MKNIILMILLILFLSGCSMADLERSLDNVDMDEVLRNMDTVEMWMD